MVEAIHVNNLSFAYRPDEYVLKDVSFDIHAGQFIGIIGPNGGGKSTLLKVLLGLLTPQKGKVNIFGDEPLNQSVGYVPQSFSLDRYFPITVLEVVLQGRIRYLSSCGSFSKEDVDKSWEALDAVGLSEYANRSFGSLSGGQIQRVLLARALVREPKILLLDEPTSSSDPEAEAVLLELLRTLADRVTILMVTHNLPVMVSAVSRILCVRQSVSYLAVEEICEHFALGLYHIPLTEQPKGHINHLYRYS